MRHERQAHRATGGAAELLDHLGLVPVSGNAICVHRFVDLGEEGPHLRGTPSTADPALGVDDDVGFDQPGAERRRAGEQRRGRVAAGHRDEIGVSERLSLELHQRIRGFAE